MKDAKDLSDVFGRFFVVAGYLPALAFIVLTRVLIVPALPTEWRTALKALAGTDLIAELTVLVVVPVFIAALLVSLSAAIVRLYEGRHFRATKEDQPTVVKRHYECQQQIETDAENIKVKKHTLEVNDPYTIPAINAELDGMRRITGGALLFETASLRTTRLGNIFAALDEYPERRYGMSMGLMWPRLRAVLPEEVDERIKSQNTSFMFLLNLSVCSLGFAVAWVALGVGSLLGWVTVSPPLWWLVLGGTLVGAYLFYRWSLPEALTLITSVTSAFDLYRGALLKLYHVSTPTSLEEEMRTWQELSLFVLLGHQRLYPPLAAPDQQKDNESKKT